MFTNESRLRWALNIFIFLMFYNLGVNLAEKSPTIKAIKRAQNNAAQVSFQCGDFTGEENYWDATKNRFEVLNGCIAEDCPDSLWVGERKQDTNLHVVAIEKALPDQVKNRWNYVDVNLSKTNKATKVVLVSQSMMRWKFNLAKPDNGFKGNVVEAMRSEDFSLDKLTVFIEAKNWIFDEAINLEEVIVVGPELVIVEGLPQRTKITYFNEEQLCAFPTAWQEIKNQENQFRRLFAALNKYTGLEITSFQGKRVGREFRVPFRSLLASERALAKPDVKLKRTIASQQQTLGMVWRRNGENLVAEAYTYRRDGQTHRVEVPAKTTQAYYELANGVLYLINNHQFGTWDPGKKKFKAVHIPLKLPAMYWPGAMTFNPLTSELLLYNDDRGGEIYALNVVTNTWRMFAEKVGYSLVAIHFDTESQKLLGARYSGRKIHSIVSFNKSGQGPQTKSLPKPVDFAKNRWHLQLTGGVHNLWLKVAHPAQPGGDMFPVQEIKTL